MEKKLMTSIKLPTSIEQQMIRQVVDDGYKFRGKSKWLIEAIEAFLMMPNFEELVDIAQEIDQLDTTVSIRLPEGLMDKLEKAVMSVRKNYPVMEGVKSNIIRASILQRLLKSSQKGQH